MMGPTMIMRRRQSFVLVAALLFAACGSDHSHDHPLAGSWGQDTGSDKKGVYLEFDTSGTKCIVHGAPREDGTHDHPSATYTWDAATKAVTVKGKLIGDAKADTWTGTLAGESLSLTGGADTLKFKKGGSAH
jgi:hypothetical protein